MTTISISITIEGRNSIVVNKLENIGSMIKIGDKHGKAAINLPTIPTMVLINMV